MSVAKGFVQRHKAVWWQVGLMLCVVGVRCVWAQAAGAAPWDSGLDWLVTTFTGPTGEKIVTLAIIVCGVVLLSGASHGLVRIVMGVVFGAAVVYKAADLAGVLGGLGG